MIRKGGGEKDIHPEISEKKRSESESNFEKSESNFEKSESNFPLLIFGKKRFSF